MGRFAGLPQRLRMVALVLALALLGPGAALTGAESGVTTSYGYAVFGELKYGARFEHFDYVNPDAPRGGSYRYASQGVSFDSLNQIALLGTIPPTLIFLYDTLMKQSRDEPASYYCLVCKTVTWPADLAWAEFELDQRARFDDGTPVTPEDIVYSANLGKGLSLPAFSRVVQTMASIEKTGPNRVRINFTMKNNPTLPTVIGLMPIMPKHYWEKRDPFKPSMEIAVSISPYRLVEADVGHSITFRRDPGYWGVDHPINRGRNNFDVVRNDYYRDAQLLNEAFRVGLSDFRLDMNASDLRQEADLPAAVEGDIRRDRLRYDNGAVYNSITFNARRPFLSDVRVRKALSLAYDFEWVKRSVLGGDYGRLASYIPNMEFEATGLPSAGELAFLEPYRDTLPPDIFSEPPSLPVGGTRAKMRANLIEARDLLREAGYRVVDGELVDPRAGEPVRLTLLAYSPLLINQTSLFIRNAAKLGIRIEFRAVDAAQMRHLARNYDFDLLYYREVFAPLPTPGAGLAQLYTSQAADTPNQFNRAGIKEPAIDNAITRMIAATDRRTVVDSLRAVDRILRFKYYSIPLQHLYAAPVGQLPISYWDKFGRPEIEQTWTFPYWSADTWWVDRRKQAALSHGIDPLSGMAAYVLRRLLLMVPTLIGIITVSFVIIQFVPGGPIEQLAAKVAGTQISATATIGGDAGGAGGLMPTGELEPEMVAELEKLYGFDRPVHERYFKMLWDFARFDFGDSYFQDRPVIELIRERLPVSISLGLWTTLLTYLISIPLGIRKAVRAGSRFDAWTSVAITLGYAIPGFLFAVVLVVLLAGGQFLSWFPTQGLVSENWEDLAWPGRIADYFWHMALPIAAMVIGAFASLTLLTKNSILDEIGKQYVITARAKGLSERGVLYGHVFRNAMLIVIAGFPTAFIGVLFTSSLLIEVIFSLDGLGLLGFEATINRDYPVMLGSLFMFSLLGLIANLLGDITYTLVDPRIDFERRDV